jgi:hypothetical protein
MLTIHGESVRSCDGVSRRQFLKIGALGVGGLALPDLLRLEARCGRGSSAKALINVWLAGGPSHQDMWDLKPEAPPEFRGEFNPIPTNVTGMHVCEFFPRLAKMADRFALVRGLVGSVDEHTPSTSMTGYREDSLRSVGGRPSIGSVVSKLGRGSEQGAPSFVSFMGPVTPGYLGPAYSPFVPDGPGRSNLRLGRIDADRLRRRTDLRNELDGLRRNVDASQVEALDAFSQRAVDMVVSGRMAEALDLEKESRQTRARYLGSGGGHFDQNRNFLLARRLIEAGVRCVAMSWGSWDTHGDNFKHLRGQLPALDAGLASLLEDFAERGMLGDVSVVVWGEFGRTPQVNKDAGRDHWPQLSAAFLAGGGMRTGRVVGASDRRSAEPVEPIHVHQVHATLYHNLGIDPAQTQLIDPAGRPQYLLDTLEPIRELV